MQGYVELKMTNVGEEIAWQVKGIFFVCIRPGLLFYASLQSLTFNPQFTAVGYILYCLV